MRKLFDIIALLKTISDKREHASTMSGLYDTGEKNGYDVALVWLYPIQPGMVGNDPEKIGCQYLLYTKPDCSCSGGLPVFERASQSASGRSCRPVLAGPAVSACQRF